MKRVTCVCFLLLWLYPAVRVLAEKPRVFVVPFSIGNQKSLQLIGNQAGYLMERKLKHADAVALVERRKLMDSSVPGISEYDRMISDYLRWMEKETLQIFLSEKKIDFVITGNIFRIQRDWSKPVEGFRALSVCRYPLSIDMDAMVVDVSLQKIVWRKQMERTEIIPRMTFLGLHKSLLPRTVRTADALIHPTVSELARQINEHFRSVLGTQREMRIPLP